MTPTIEAERPIPHPVALRRRTPVRIGTEAARCAAAASVEVLDRYIDGEGRRREVLKRAGSCGSVLVIDRDLATLGDRRLIAHLAADESAANATAVCAAYMRSPDAAACRRVLAEDLSTAPPSELEALAAELLADDESTGDWALALESEDSHGPTARGVPLAGANDESFTLEPCAAGMSIPELRWCRRALGLLVPRPVSVRDVVGALQSYEPARTLTARALAAHGDDPTVSVATLRVELERLNASRTVLNRRLRAAVLAQVARGSLSMSEIALRCGRVKRDRRRIVSGETTWLARRIGIAAETQGVAPTPWVHSDVLALIAREGLGISPREVELG